MSAVVSEIVLGVQGTVIALPLLLSPWFFLCQGETLNIYFIQMVQPES